MQFHCEQGADAAARSVALPLARLKQLPDLAELAIHQQIEADRRLGADRQDAAGTMVGERVIKRALKKVIERDTRVGAR